MASYDYFITIISAAMTPFIFLGEMQTRCENQG